MPELSCHFSLNSRANFQSRDCLSRAMTHPLPNGHLTPLINKINESKNIPLPTPTLQSYPLPPEEKLYPSLPWPPTLGGMAGYRDWVGGGVECRGGVGGREERGEGGKCSKNASKHIPLSPIVKGKLELSSFWLNSDPHPLIKGKLDLCIHNNHLLNFKYRAAQCW